MFRASNDVAVVILTNGKALKYMLFSDWLLKLLVFHISLKIGGYRLFVDSMVGQQMALVSVLIVNYYLLGRHGVIVYLRNIEEIESVAQY